MASAAREYRYAHREFSTNGSLARDLDWAVRERELEHAGEVPRHERTQAAPKVYHKEHHVGNLAVIELLRRVSGRAAAPAEALDPRRLNRGMS